MEFRIADTFTDSLDRLTAQEQKAAKTTAFDLQLDSTSNGLSFHKLDRAKDTNFWSVRVNAERRHRRHRPMDAGHRLERGILLRPPRLFPRRQRPQQGAEDHAECRDRLGSLGEPVFRHVAPVREAEVRPDRGEGDQPPRRRGDKGVCGGVSGE